MLTRTWTDRLVGFFSPAAELDRVRHRAATAALARHYEGGSGGRRTDSWRTPSSGPTAASAATLSILRNRSRDLVRNNPWARNAVDDLESETVGTGILPKIKGRTGKSTRQVGDLWKAWAGTTQCDADGLHDFYGLQALAFRTIAESGEVLIRRRMRRVEDGLAVPMQLQILEPDYLDVTRDVQRGDGSMVRGGIEFDPLGRRKGYWLYPEHPGENLRFIPSQASNFVPAENVAHLFRVERPGQIRGVPWGASVIVKLRDFDEYEDAHLQRQKIAACFAVFIHDADANGSPAALSGIPEDTNDPATPAKPKTERVYPGMIERLEPGKEITFGSPPGVDGLDTYSRNVLRGVAAGFGTTYEALSGDYSEVNFSSARLGWIRHTRRVEKWRWHIVVPRLCDRAFAWFLDSADVLGLDVREASATWSPPRRDMLDPKSEVIATRSEVRAGLKSLSAAIRERGDDPEEVFLELEADRNRLDELDLVIESDARRPSNGQPGDPAAQGSGTGPQDAQDPQEAMDAQDAADAAQAAQDAATPAKKKARAKASRPRTRR